MALALLKRILRSAEARGRSSTPPSSTSASRNPRSASRRTVDLGPATLKLLREQQLARAPNPDGLLFATRTGAAYEPHNFMNRVFTRVRQFLGTADPIWVPKPLEQAD